MSGASVKDRLRESDRAEVYRRDGGCIAPLVDPEAGPCRRRDGRETDRTDPRARTIDHVPPQQGSTRISSPRWMVWVCWGHMEAGARGGHQWNTAHRDDERQYLWRIYNAPPWQFTVDEWNVAAVARTFMTHRRS